VPFEYRPVDIDELRNAPARWTVSVDLECTPDALFDVLEDADAWPRWLGLVGAVQWHGEPPFGVGTTRTIDMRGPGFAEEYFFAWERPRRLAFYFTRGSVPVNAFSELYDVTDLGDGRCRLEWTMAVHPKRGTGWLMRAGSPLMRWTNGIWLDRLARYVAQS
jgi:hypothetical protein